MSLGLPVSWHYSVATGSMSRHNMSLVLPVSEFMRGNSKAIVIGTNMS